MSRISWNDAQISDYSFGVDHGVVYIKDEIGIIWDGLVSIDESPTESEDRPRYLDGVRIGNRRRYGSFSAEVTALNQPFDNLNKRFGFSYRTSTARGNQIHMVYNALLSPSGVDYTHGVPSTFKWSLTSRGVVGPGGITVSHMYLDTSVAYPSVISAFEDILYGTTDSSPRLPDPFEAFEIFEAHSILRVIDHGDGSWTAIGPDSAIVVNQDGTFTIEWPSAVYVSNESYNLSSL